VNVCFFQQELRSCFLLCLCSTSFRPSGYARHLVFESSDDIFVVIITSRTICVVACFFNGAWWGKAFIYPVCTRLALSRPEMLRRSTFAFLSAPLYMIKKCFTVFFIRFIWIFFMTAISSPLCTRLVGT